MPENSWCITLNHIYLNNIIEVCKYVKLGLTFHAFSDEIIETVSNLVPANFEDITTQIWILDSP